MTNSQFISAYCLALLSLSLLSCEPIDLQYATAVKSAFIHDVETDQKSDELYEGQPLLTRSAQKEFKEHFLSDKLELVFVLDTGPGMEAFYHNNPFGAGFLSQFQNYDWKFAYTDMSMDMQKITNQAKNSSGEKKEKSCNFLEGLTMTVGGLFIGQGVPLLSAFGIEELSKCKLSSENSDSSQIKYANGDFLPLEYKGEIAQTQNFRQITKNTDNYNEIFDHSLRQSNPTTEEEPNYSAPVLRQTESYPFLSTAFSIAKALNSPQSASDSKSPTSFFRKDSLVIYVLATTQDMKITIPPKQFMESIESAFNSHQRFKLILITLTDDSPLFCSLKLQKTSTDSIKLRQLAKKLHYPSLDICSNQLGEKLFKEISKNLSSANLLNN